MLSADAESNPVPLSENEQVLFDAIKASESRVLQKNSRLKVILKRRKVKYDM